MTWGYAFGRMAWFAGVFGLSIIAHETGHMIAYRLLFKKKPPVKVKNREYIITLPECDYKQRQIIIAGGIGLGALVIMLLASSFYLIEFVLLMLLYVWGCKHDIKMWKAMG